MQSFSWQLVKPLTSVASLTVLGIALRTYHYARNPSMWHDEAALVINVLEKNFLELLGPLLFQEAAPPLFMWLERAVALTLGESTFALRVIPFLASSVGMILMAWIATQVLNPASARWAILLFGCSDRLLWHACEAKPYAMDVLAALTVLAIFLATRTWPLLGRLGLFSATVPFLILTVYPGCFIFAGLALALTPSLFRSRKMLPWIAFAALLLIAAGCFTFLLMGPARAQRGTAMESCWISYFPDWQRPETVPFWIAKSLFGVVDYSCRPIGGLLVPLFIVGCVCFWRRRECELLTLALVPGFLALVASLAGFYPFGGARILAYASAPIILCIAEAVPTTVGLIRNRTNTGSLALLLAIATPPIALSIYHVAKPWERADADGASKYVLELKEPQDRVTANHWEYSYYFRSLGARFLPLERFPNELNGRLWLVITASTVDERVRIAQHFTSVGWAALDQRDFARTTVLLMSRPDKGD